LKNICSKLAGREKSGSDPDFTTDFTTDFTQDIYMRLDGSFPSNVTRMSFVGFSILTAGVVAICGSLL